MNNISPDNARAKEQKVIFAFFVVLILIALTVLFVTFEKQTRKNKIAAQENTAAPAARAQNFNVEPYTKEELRAKEDAPTTLQDEAFVDACFKGDLEAARGLLNSGANINARIDSDFTALMVAAGKGHVDVLEMLISRGAELNLRSQEGITAVFLAVSEKHNGAVSSLAAAGANVNLAHFNGLTPAMVAVLNNDIDTVKTLIYYGADLNAQNSEGMTAQKFAVLKIGRGEGSAAMLSVLGAAGGTF